MANLVHETENMFTMGIYHGRQDEPWKSPFKSLDKPLDEIITMIQIRVIDDANSIDWTPIELKRAFVEFCTDRSRIQEVYTAVQEEHEKNIEYQQEVAQEVADKMGETLEWDEDEWREDHCYDNDTIDFVCRVLANKAKWSVKL